MKKLVLTALCVSSVLALPGCWGTKEEKPAEKAPVTHELPPAPETSAPSAEAPKPSEMTAPATEEHKPAEAPAPAAEIPAKM